MGCSAHQRKIDQAKSDGNDPLAQCFETCEEGDQGCYSSCEKRHPTQWHQKYTAPAKRMSQPWKKLWGSVTEFMHPIAVQSARNDGNIPLAECYEACSPDGLKCLTDCESKHASAAEKKRRIAMQRYLVNQGLQAAVAQENSRRQKKAARRTPASSSSGSSSGTSSGTSARKPPRNRGSSCGSQTCKVEQRCLMTAKDNCQGRDCFNYGCVN